MSRRALKVSRAQAGGGREVPLQFNPAAVPPQPYGDVVDWFGPLQPPRETAPPDVTGRRFDFPSGYNISQYPRAYEPISFPELRALADGYDLMRVAIETRKKQLAKMQWSMSPRDEKVDVETNPDIAARIKKYEELFRRPDRRMFWSRWLNAVVEDLLVLDAPAVYIRRTLGGDVYSLCHMDGGTIKVVLDEQGNLPVAPYAAYQQILKGLPARNYSTQDLVYLPMNPRTNRVYGFGPVEQIIMTVNIAIRRQLWQLAYFTNGNVPDSLIGVPDTWTPDQIRQFQDWFDSILMGNSERRRGATFVPGQVAKSYVPTKEAEIFGAAEEWLGRVICWAFGLSHQALVKEVNRATADTAREMALEEGLSPYMQWVKELVDTILIDIMGETEIEFRWVDEKELDAGVQAEVLGTYVDKGIVSRNYARRQLGEDPDPSPEADMLMVTLGTGPVPLDSDAQIEAKQKNVEAFGPAPGASEDEPSGNLPKSGETSSTQAGGERGSGEAAPGGGGGGGATKTATLPPTLATGGDGSQPSGRFRHAY